MRFVSLIGSPATGKTTITRKILADFGSYEKVEAPYILAMDYQSTRMLVLGMYDEELFSGTDRLSMAVEPKMKEWLLANQEKYKDYTVFFEGDRLGTTNFFEWLNKNFNDNVYFYVNASDEIKHKRHIERGDSQTEKFLKGRETKYKNILSSMDGIYYLSNNTEEELQNCVEIIQAAIMNPPALEKYALKRSKKIRLF